MSKRTDKILDVIDVGLQHSRESGCGSDVDRHTCARCRVNPLTEQKGDLCAGCRAYLLEDSDVDPSRGTGGWQHFINAAGDMTTTPPWAVEVMRTWGIPPEHWPMIADNIVLGSD